MKKYLILTGVLSLFFGSLNAFVFAKHDFEKTIIEPDYQKIDAHARHCPKREEQSIKRLASYLEKQTRTDLEKARAIYIWLTDRIRYDDDAYNSGVYGDDSAASILKSKVAVCEGFSNLYLALGQEMGLEIKKIVGYAKGYGLPINQKLKKTNHAWNIIKINGQWRLFDATWGQGYGETENGQLVSYKEFEDFWFDTDPYRFIFSHYPEDSRYTLVSPSLSLTRYFDMKKIEPDYFKLGFDGMTAYKKARVSDDFEIPKCYAVDVGVQVVQAPAEKKLRLNDAVTLSFQSQEVSEMAVIEGKKWTFFEKKGHQFTLKLTPNQRGELKVSVKYPKSGRRYMTLLSYKVM